jgi:DNA polymerase
MTIADPSLARECEAALAWWRAAGVDCDFGDDATAWLSELPIADASGRAGLTDTAALSDSDQAAMQPPRAALAGGQALRSGSPPHPALAAPCRNLLGDSPPVDLAAFQQWWMTAEAIDAARLYPRIAPRGPAGAPLMVLVPQPEEQDRTHLLGGPQGRLLKNILAAMGLDESEAYIAAALPCHTPMADLGTLAAGGMDAVTAHHIGLAAPQQLLVFGTGLGAMLGHEQEQPLREINQATGKVRVMVSETLEALMEMPRLKARFWRRWMEWSALQ